MPEHDWRLCYVEDCWAFFTTRPLDEQWGDDWDDAPYEHNAGAPYDDEDYPVLRVAWYADLVTPAYGYVSSPWSVEDINAGKVAWLDYPTWRAWRDERRLFAGATLDEFIKFVTTAIGQVFLPTDYSGRTEGSR